MVLKRPFLDIEYNQNYYKMAVSVICIQQQLLSLTAEEWTSCPCGTQGKEEKILVYSTKTNICKSECLKAEQEAENIRASKRSYKAI